MNERRIVEHALLISMLSKVVEKGATNFTSPSVVTASHYLSVAALEVLEKAPPPSRPKLERRINGYGQRCITPQLKTGTQIAHLGLAAYAILEHLIDEDYLVIGRESPLSIALDNLLPALELSAAIKDNMERGRLMAQAIFLGFQNEGLFAHVRTFKAL